MFNTSVFVSDIEVPATNASNGFRCKFLFKTLVFFSPFFVFIG